MSETPTTRLPRRSRVPASAYRLGLFSLVCAVLLGLLAMLVGNLSFAPSREFHAEFTDATGVAVGDRVRLSGVEIGRVTDVGLDTEQNLARVSFTVEEGVPVYESAQLVLRYENLLGQRYLEVTERPGGPEMAAGATFGTDRTTPALSLTVLFNGFQPLFRALEPEQVNRLSELVVQALQGEGSTYAELLSATAGLTSTLADKDRVIGQVVDDLGAVLQVVDQRDQKLTGLIVTFRQLMTGLADDRQQIAGTLPGLRDLLSISTDYLQVVRPPLRGAVEGLDEVAGVLDRAVLDESLRRLPFRMRQMARTGSYGTSFNYYACGFSLNLRLLGSDYLLQSPAISANERDTVCGRGAE